MTPTTHFMISSNFCHQRGACAPLSPEEIFTKDHLCPLLSASLIRNCNNCCPAIFIRSQVSHLCVHVCVCECVCCVCVWMCVCVLCVCVVCVVCVCECVLCVCVCVQCTCFVTLGQPMLRGPVYYTVMFASENVCPPTSTIPRPPIPQKIYYYLLLFFYSQNVISELWLQASVFAIVVKRWK
jgi:hypothetical protein